MFDLFDEVRIISLIDRSDRRREMTAQLQRLGGMPANSSFFDAVRPTSPAEFPSIGARGCFESHLAVLREARDSGVKSLLVLEDDLDFTREGRRRIGPSLAQLAEAEWSFFYGAHVLTAAGRSGLVRISPDEPMMTTSCVAFKGKVIPELVDFLEAMMLRPAGSPDYGPMHVDGAYSVFRKLHPSHPTLVMFPSLGRQRSSPSDVTPGSMLLDRWSATGSIASFLRRAYNWTQRL